ncbi:MAG: hypothetical protein ACLSVD_10170 [Eggerthellaceae bacterium]
MLKVPRGHDHRDRQALHLRGICGRLRRAVVKLEFSMDNGKT